MYTHVSQWTSRLIAVALLAVTLVLVPKPTPAEAAIPGCLAGEIVDIASTKSGNGYWLVGSDGGVFSFGDAQFFGSMGGKPLNKSVVSIVATASGNGYWLVAADGGVFAFGDAVAPAGNPLPGMTLNQPVIESTRTTTNGLALVAADGGVFALGGSPFYGSMGGKPLNKPMVDIVSSPSGAGYWLVAADGGIFAFGDAQPVSSNPLPSSRLAAPVVAGARSGNTGLLLTAGDGGVFALGGANFQGSMAGTQLAKPVSGIATSPTGNGYWLTALDGGAFAFPIAGGAYFGNAVGNPTCDTPAPAPVPTSKIVKVATDIMTGKAVTPWKSGAVPYVWGGGHGAVGPSTGTCAGYTGSIKPCPATKTVGVDCSGLSRWVYQQAYGRDIFGGVNTNGQIAKLKKVSTPQPGDLVYFGSSPSNTHHVGIYIGNGRMINALRTGTSVKTDNVSIMSDLVGYYRYA